MVMLSAVQMFEAVGFDALVAFTTDEAIGHLEGRSGIAVVFAEYDAPGSLDGPALARLVQGAMAHHRDHRGVQPAGSV